MLLACCAAIACRAGAGPVVKQCAIQGAYVADAARANVRATGTVVAVLAEASTGGAESVPVAKHTLPVGVLDNLAMGSARGSEVAVVAETGAVVCAAYAVPTAYERRRASVGAAIAPEAVRTVERECEARPADHGAVIAAVVRASVSGPGFAQRASSVEAHPTAVADAILHCGWTGNVARSGGVRRVALVALAPKEKPVR